MRRLSCVLGLVLVLVPPGAAWAKDLPQLTPRQLVVEADAVVRAEAPGGQTPYRFRILEVLRGSDLRAGDMLAWDDLGPRDLKIVGEIPPAGQELQPQRIVEALFFLGPREGKRARQLVFSGLRFRTEDGGVLTPKQVKNPGLYLLTLRPEVDWDALLRQVRADCAAHGRLLAARGLARPGPRCRALLDWVEEHRAEFGSHSGGWGRLEQDVFQWVVAAGGVEDCWEAVTRYAELNRGAVLPLLTQAFTRPGGRELLLRVALSEGQLEGDRVRALALLADPRTLWSEESGSPIRPLTEKGQEEMIDHLLPLLKTKSATVRGAAARALHTASAARERQTKRALAALTAAYRAEPPGPARDDLAAAVHAIGGPAHWQELTGNPRGLFARLHDLGHQGGKVFFWLHLDSDGLSVHECPTLTFDRLDGDRVAEAKTELLPVTNLPKSWNDGWNGSPYLLAEFPTGGLAPGTWRLTVRGTAGKDKDKVKWAAEPRTFVVKPAAPGAEPEVIYIDW